MYLSFVFLIHDTFLEPIIFSSSNFALTPHKYVCPYLSVQVCFISGVSIPYNLIFSELSIIVSPSIIFNDELAFKTFEKANVLINKIKKIF